MTRIAILSALMNDYDTLKPTLPQDDADVRWVCLTDSAALLAEAEERLVPDGHRGEYLALVHPTGWELMPYHRPPGEHPNRAAKAPKVNPGMFTDRLHSVWLDASFRVVSPRFAADMVAAADGSRDGVAQFRHPWRDDCMEEAMFSIGLPKYAGEADRIDRQWRAYREAGMPSAWGLWATGVIARHHTDEVLAWGAFWGREIVQHSYQDQVSHPFACWRHGIRPADLPGTHLGNEWLAYEGSGRH